MILECNEETRDDPNLHSTRQIPDGTKLEQLVISWRWFDDRRLNGQGGSDEGSCD
jgi:hypothetical protein